MLIPAAIPKAIPCIKASICKAVPIAETQSIWEAMIVSIKPLTLVKTD